jgi:hypothetical protein
MKFRSLFNKQKYKHKRRNEEMKNLVTAKTLGEKLSISKRTVCRWKNLGMPYIQISYKTVRYDLDEVMEWIKVRNEEQTGAEAE